MNGPKVIDEIQFRCLSKSDYLLGHPMHPLCRKVRGGDNQQERPRYVLEDYTVESSETIRRTSHWNAMFEEDRVRTAWRHADVNRNV